MSVSLIMCISKILTDSRLIRLNIKQKNIFVSDVYSVLVVKIFLIKHKEDCLVINGKQNVKLESGTISFEIILNKFMLILSVF